VGQDGSSTHNFQLQDLASGNIMARANHGSGTNNSFTVADFSNNSSYGVSRTGASSVGLYVNGSLDSSHTPTSTGIPSTVTSLLKAGGGQYGNTSWRLSVAWIGSGNVDQSKMHSRIQTAMTAIAALP
jgi:hypothetical protein